MRSVSEADCAKLLDVVHAAADVAGDVPFPQSVLEALQRLVPCDVVAYHERPSGSAKRIVWTGEPRGPVTPTVRAGQRRYAHQDPLKPGPGARKYSDFFSAREFRRLGLYWEVARPLGVEDMFRVWLEPDGKGEARLEFDRPRRTFGERDRHVLDLLLPHLRQLRRNAEARRRPAGAELTPREREIVELVREGKRNSEIGALLWISPETVRKHLENVYAKLGVHTRTAAVAALSHEARRA